MAQLCPMPGAHTACAKIIATPPDTTMPTLLKRYGLWALAWAAGALLGGWLLARAELVQLQEAFDTDARIAHRLLSQRAVQHDAILATLALLRTADANDQPEQRLPAVYPQILSVQRADANTTWTDPALTSAQAQSRGQNRAVLAAVDLDRGRYKLVLAGPSASYAMTIDIHQMVPWIDWPTPPDSSPVRVTLTQGAQSMVLQPGQEADAPHQGWHFYAEKTLASPSQPLLLVSQQQVGWAALPWSSMLGWAAVWAALLWAGHVLLQLRADRLRAEDRLRLGQLTRLNTLGELAAGMAHELNQPLTAVLANTQAALRMLDDDEADPTTLQAALQQTVQQARRASEVVGRLRRTVERPGSAVQTTNLMEVARRALYLLEPELQRSQTTPTLQWQGAPFDVLADGVALEQIVHNLLSNALQALDQVPPDERQLHLTLEQRGELGCLTVQDSGPGIASEVLPRVFEPFFTTRADGLGLGLSLCETLAQGMGGTLNASHHTPRGAVFSLCLPLAPASASAP